MEGFRFAERCVLGQFFTIADHQRLVQFGHLLTVIQQLKSFEGLASPFLSGLNTAALAGDTAKVKQACDLWKAHGRTATSSNQLILAFIVDATNKTFAAIGPQTEGARARRRPCEPPPGSGDRPSGGPGAGGGHHRYGRGAGRGRKLQGFIQGGLRHSRR